MPDNFLNAEEALNNLLDELSKIKTANQQISILEDIAKETSIVAETVNKSSLELIARAKAIFDQIEKAKLESSLKVILEQIRENKRNIGKNSILLFVVIIIQVIFFTFAIISKYP